MVEFEKGFRIADEPPTPELGAVPWDDEFFYLTEDELRPRLLEALAPAGEMGVNIASKSEVWAVRYAPGEKPPYPETALERLFAEVTQILQERLVAEYDVPWDQARFVALRQNAYSPFTPRRCVWIDCPDGSSVRACVTC